MKLRERGKRSHLVRGKFPNGSQALAVATGWQEGPRGPTARLLRELANSHSRVTWAVSAALCPPFGSPLRGTPTFCSLQGPCNSGTPVG